MNLREIDRLDDSEFETCARCQCCGMEWQDCYNCDEDGMVDHDCAEDCCCCLDPVPNVRCDICRGKGGWKMCGGRCDEDGKHKPAALKSVGCSIDEVTPPGGGEQ